MWPLGAGSYQGVNMAKIKLTKSAVEAAQPQVQSFELRDTLVPGFLCKVLVSLIRELSWTHFITLLPLNLNPAVPPLKS